MWENILVLLAVVFLLWLFNIPIGRSKNPKPRGTSRKGYKAAPSPVRRDEERLELAHLLPPESEQAAKNFDWNSARAELQKVAYAMAGRGWIVQAGSWLAPVLG